eukprot:NODE_4687_length_560_cov_208.365949_g3419_i0.p1 GENE.NODE_4687_length_560_cov_208.365949_g3419_i0~~NODE_4687_length_560_cov_208.365949_g3419_i0.p1  ORF type:complete len:94 (-),score=18.98 NODE_4687_length_560_cov_208.365949_g3419_i0:278-532(-)
MGCLVPTSTFVITMEKQFPWVALKEAVSSIPCGPCQEHATEIFSFLRDADRLKNGDAVMDVGNFNKIADQVKCVRKNCLADGRC